MYDIKRTTYTQVNDELIAKTTYWTARKDRSESAQVTAQMAAKAKATRKAYGRMERQEEDL